MKRRWPCNHRLMFCLQKQQIMVRRFHRKRNPRMSLYWYNSLLTGYCYMQYFRPRGETSKLDTILLVKKGGVVLHRGTRKNRDTTNPIAV